MIKINKTPLPDGVTITREKDYRSGIAYKMLENDQHRKCYICEDSVHTSPNVDHLIPHKGNPDLKYKWDNLFLSCHHCNKVKHDNYEGVIDPAKVNPEEFIELSVGLDDKLREVIVVSKVKGNFDVDITISLLNAVYNGTSTDMIESSTQSLRNKISDILALFYQTLEEYRRKPTDASKAAVKLELHDCSIFAAFKRGMVRNIPEVHKDFSHELLSI